MAQGVFTSSLPELYERFLVEPLFRPFAEALLDRVGLARDDRLLDVACGTGIVARLARQIVGERAAVVGVDASPGMLEVARSVAPAIDWRQGDAARLPLGDGETFDVLTCHQGLQFFGDKPAAALEMRRALAPGGRIALGTWVSVAEVPLIHDLQSAAEWHLGPYVDTRHSFGDAGAISRLLVDAGFHSAQVDTVVRAVRIPRDVFAQLNTMAIVGMSPAAKAMTDEQRAQVVSAVTNESLDVMKPYLVGGDLVFDIGSTIVTARA